MGFFMCFLTFQEKCCILPNLTVVIPNTSHDCLDPFGLLDYSLRYRKKKKNPWFLFWSVLSSNIFSPPAFCLLQPSQLGRNWFTNPLICEALRFLTNIPNAWDSGLCWNENKVIPQACLNCWNDIAIAKTKYLNSQILRDNRVIIIQVKFLSLLFFCLLIHSF